MLRGSDYRDACTYRVRQYLRSGQWRTLSEISHACACSEAAASARLRDLRKKAFGAFRVQRAYRSDGVFAYRLVPGSEGRGNPRTRARLLTEISYWKKRAQHYEALWRVVQGLAPKLPPLPRGRPSLRSQARPN